MIAAKAISVVFASAWVEPQWPMLIERIAQTPFLQETTSRPDNAAGSQFAWPCFHLVTRIGTKRRAPVRYWKAPEMLSSLQDVG
jgi:hypothetical protein